MALPLSLTSAGLQIPTMDDVHDDIAEDILEWAGPTYDLDPSTPAGEFIDIFAERYVMLCELLQAVYSSQDPDAATGEALEQLAALTGSLRAEATPSEVTLTLTGTPTSVVPAGSRAGTATGVEFETVSGATIAALAAWAISTAYVVGDRRTNSSRAYICITAGTSAGSGGPATTADDITDGTAHWRYMGDGTGAVDAASEATVTGPRAALTGTVTEIVTPVAGWSGVINLLDADLGTDIETDAALRVRREEEIAQPGTGPLDAVRVDLLQLDGVTNVTVFHNVTDVTDADGVPPHSAEALIQGGDDQDIFDQLLASVPAGIRTWGTTTGTSNDSSGNPQTMRFTRPTSINIYVDVSVSYDARHYPSDGDAQIKAAIVAYGDALLTGYNVRASAVSAACFGVAGVLEVTVVEIGTAPSPSSSATIAIGTRELALFDTSRIVVTSGAVTP